MTAALRSAGRRAWTAHEVLALGVRTDLVTACQIVYGCGKNRAWELYHARALDFPALRCGRRVAVPVAPLLQLLGLSPETNGAGPRQSPAAAQDPTNEATTDAHRTGATARPRTADRPG